jgi:Tol biopolymer transport system component
MNRPARTLGLLLSFLFLLTTPALAQEDQAPDGRKRMTMEESLLLPSWGSYSLSPDNSKLVFTKREMDPEEWESVTHIWIHDLETGESFQLTNSANGESGPQWLPDGRVRFTSGRGEGDDAENRLWVISVAGGEAALLFDDDEAPTNGDFTEDYSTVAYTEASDRPDKEEWEEREKERDDGYYAEQKLTYTHIWVYDAETKEKTQITEGEFDHQGPQWSPDGEWIAFTSNRTQSRMGDPDRSDNSDILVVSAQGGEPRNLTASNSGGDRGPVWSPDGNLIAYTGSLLENSGAGQSDVFVVPVNGGEPRNLTEEMDYSVSGVRWSEDGRTIYFGIAKGLTGLFYSVPASGGEPEMVLPDDEYMYNVTGISEDGTKILFTGSSTTTTG